MDQPSDDVSMMRDASSARVLVVDDDHVYRGVLEQLLKAAGYSVETAENGREALEKIQTARPEVVVTDSVMPTMDGLTLCRLIKGNHGIRSTYVIILSSHGETSAKVTGLDLGADDYLVKPVEPIELKARVRSGLRLHRALRELATKNELLERLALTDPLTRLANRRAFEESLATEVARTGRHGKHLSLLFLDLDRFKDVNDTYGHVTGDEVLAGFADLLRRFGRRGDLAARIGGEEFAVLLPHTTKANAMIVAERIRRAVEETPFGRARVAVTVSIGVAELPEEGEMQESSFVELADGALYRAKAGGRNRVSAA
jgi:diguanylate cyclase (GGDEF)-like protein